MSPETKTTPNPADTDPGANPEMSRLTRARLIGEVALHDAVAWTDEVRAYGAEEGSHEKEKDAAFLRNLGEVAIGHIQDPENVDIRELTPAPANRKQRRIHQKVIKREGKALEAEFKARRAEAIHGINYGHGDALKRGHRMRFGHEERAQRRYRNEFEKETKARYKANEISKAEYDRTMSYIKYGTRRGTDKGKDQDLYDGWFQHIAPKSVLKERKHHQIKAKKVLKTVNSVHKKARKSELGSVKLHAKSVKLEQRAQRRKARADEIDDTIIY